MKKLLFWLLIAVAVVLAVAVIGAAGYVMDWAVWKVAVVILAALAVVAGVILLIRALAKARQARKEAEPAEAAGQGPEEAERRRAVDRKWKAFLRDLKRSVAGRKGDPVYALPWYLFLGAPGSGKTTAIRNSQLVVPSATGGAEGGDAPLECRLLENAIALDAPGYYSIHRGGADAAEWGEFLSLLAGTRKQEPLNGVVLTVAADRLLASGEEEQKQAGVALRQRVDELTRKLGVHPPLYVLVTRCDLVGGMVRFFRYLPEECWPQALGGLNDERNLARPQDRFLDELFDGLYRRLAEVRLTLAGEVPTEELHPESVLFPEELLDLKAPLERFLEGLFEKNPYRESPFFRGLYFSSGRQEGQPSSRYLSRLGLQDEVIPLAKSEKSLFLKDFFQKILAGDRALVAPTSRALGWRRLTQSLGLTGWLLLCVLVAVLLSASFAKNLAVIRGAANRSPPTPYLGPDFKANVTMLDQLRQALEATREKNRDWLLPRLGLTQSERLERQMAAAYSGRLRRGVLDPLDEDLDRTLGSVATSGDSSLVARHINFLSTRARLLQMAESGEHSVEALSAAGTVDFGLVLPPLAGRDSEQLAPVVSREYLAYLAWSDDPRELNKDLQAERARLGDFLSRKGIGFSWLIEWANLQPTLEPITLGQYWGAEPKGSGPGRTSIDRAYTPQGWEAINRFIAEATGTVSGEESVGKALARFKADYGRNYLAQWEGFLKGFPRGYAAWNDPQQRRDLAAKLAGPDSPYERLLAAVPEGIEPGVTLAKSEEDVPAWVPLVYRYQKLNDPEYQRALKGTEGGVVGKLATAGEKVLGGLKAKLRGEETADQTLAQDRKALPFLTTYRDTLKQAAAQVLSSQAAFQLARDTFAEADVRVGEPEKAVAKNFWSQSKLRGIYSRGNPGEEVFWQLLAKPAEQVWAILLEESQPYLERTWEDEVLGDTKGLSGWDLVDALLGPSGKVWAFEEKYAAPFLSRDQRRGYVPRELYRSALPFSDGFLRVLNLGKLGGKALDATYRVQVSALPTGANPGATIQPHRTTLVLQCGSGNQEIVNLNYPVSKTLNWSPRDCSDVVLEVAVGDAVLTKRYGGYTGFIQFLSDFRSGSDVLRADDFPRQAKILGAYNVKNITVSYAFKGQGAVLHLSRYYPSVVPQKIIE